MARHPIIRSIDLTESFQLEDDTTLTEEEKKEAEQLQRDEQLRRSDPAAYNALVFQRRQTQATMPMMAAPGGQYLNPGSRVLEGRHAGAVPGQETLLSAYGTRDAVLQTAIATSLQVQDRPSVTTQLQMGYQSSSEASDFERRPATENLSPLLGGHTTALPPQAPRPTLFQLLLEAGSASVHQYVQPRLLLVMRGSFDGGHLLIIANNCIKQTK